MVTGHIGKEISAHCSLQQSPPLGSLLRRESGIPTRRVELEDSVAEIKHDSSLCWPLHHTVIPCPAQV